MEKIKDVHTEHCCQIHGCKYGPAEWSVEANSWVEIKCTVKDLVAPQSFPCEWCGDEDELDRAYEQNEMFNRGAAWAIQQAHDLAAIIFGG